MTLPSMITVLTAGSLFLRWTKYYILWWSWEGPEIKEMVLLETHTANIVQGHVINP